MRVNLPVPGPPVTELGQEPGRGGKALDEPLRVPVGLVGGPVLLRHPGALLYHCGLHNVVGLGQGDGSEGQEEAELVHDDWVVLVVYLRSSEILCSVGRPAAYIAGPALGTVRTIFRVWGGWLGQN